MWKLDLCPLNWSHLYHCYYAGEMWICVDNSIDMRAATGDPFVSRNVWKRARSLHDSSKCGESLYSMSGNLSLSLRSTYCQTSREGPSLSHRNNKSHSLANLVCPTYEYLACVGVRDWKVITPFTFDNSSEMPHCTMISPERKPKGIGSPNWSIFHTDNWIISMGCRLNQGKRPTSFATQWSTHRADSH